MDGTGHILFLLSQGEVSSSFLRGVPAGELITLARTNSAIRAELHYFGQPHAHPAATQGVRHELQIGHHDTIRWKRLKANAPYECSSSTHTKGNDVKPCRYCSKLICGACMTRASFAKGEKTFQNRCRSFCESCWMSGNRHQRQKLTDDCDCHQDDETSKTKTTQEVAEPSKTCECTNKNDGWVCLDCKHLQNKIWPTKSCFSEGCSNPLDSAAERRKICMWCDKPLPIIATRENPHVYKQKVVDAMAQEAANRQADLEAHASRRRKRLRMSLRELRGDQAVSFSPHADDPNLVRHLDTVNYSQILGYEGSCPTPSQVYDSKLGSWQYSCSFLLSFRSRCDFISVPRSVKDATRSSHPTAPERTNRELFAQLNKECRAEEKRQHWERYRDQILWMYELEQKSVSDIQEKIFKDYGIWKSIPSYQRKLKKWQKEAAAAGVESMKNGAPGPMTDRDLPNYWHDVGPAGRDNGTDQGSHDRRPASSSHQPLIPNRFSGTTAAPENTWTAHHTPDQRFTPFPEIPDLSPHTRLARGHAPSLGHGISQAQENAQSIHARRHARSENMAAHLRGEEDEEMEENGGEIEEATVGRNGLRNKEHRQGGATNGEEAEENKDENDQDEINRQIAIQESLIVQDAMETSMDTEGGAMQTDASPSSFSETQIEAQRRIQQHTEEPRQQDHHSNDTVQPREDAQSDGRNHEHENQNVSLPDGRPPEYFA